MVLSKQLRPFGLLLVVLAVGSAMAHPTGDAGSRGPNAWCGLFLLLLLGTAHLLLISRTVLPSIDLRRHRPVRSSQNRMMSPAPPNRAGDLLSRNLTILGAAGVSLSLHLLVFVLDPASELRADDGSPSALCRVGLFLLFLSSLCLLTLPAWVAAPNDALPSAVFAALGVALPGLCLHLVAVVEMAEGLGGLELFFLFLVGFSLSIMLPASTAVDLRGRRRTIMGILSISIISLALGFIGFHSGLAKADFLLALFLFLSTMSAYLVALRSWIAADRRRARDLMRLLGFAFLCLGLQFVVFNPAAGGGGSTIQIFGLFLVFLAGVGLLMLCVLMSPATSSSPSVGPRDD